MKVVKALIGKRVCLTWRDPCTFSSEGLHEMAVIPTRDSLPIWEECGWVAAVNDGLVKLVHARCKMPASSLNGMPEETGTVVFEDLVETLEVWPDVVQSAYIARLGPDVQPNR